MLRLLSRVVTCWRRRCCPGLSDWTSSEENCEAGWSERSGGDGKEGRRPASGQQRALPVHLHVVPQVGLGGEALVALLAGERLLLGVDAAVTDELSGHPEGLPAVRALVAFGLSVDAPVVLQGHQVGELLLARAAEVGPGLVAVLVVEQGAGVAVRATALAADEAPGAAARNHRPQIWEERNTKVSVQGNPQRVCRL